jgi:hypothetical protein
LKSNKFPVFLVFSLDFFLVFFFCHLFLIIRERLLHPRKNEEKKEKKTYKKEGKTGKNKERDRTSTLLARIDHKHTSIAVAKPNT